MKLFMRIRLYALIIPMFLLIGCGSGDGGGGGSGAAGTGTGSFALNAAKTEMTFEITVEGLSGAITAAHFHNAAAGADGPIVRTITSSFSSTASGVWKNTDSEPLTPALVAELEAGRIYVNVHTAANPDGEIRGQLLQASPGSIGLTAKLNGDNEVPPVMVSGTGTGAFVLNAANDELSFDITVTDLSGAITAAHFHNADVGFDGPPVRTITSSFSNTASGVWKSTDSEPLTPAYLVELMAGRIYVNIHTAANPGGEIRGQLLVNTGSSFMAKLTGSAETGGGGGGSPY